MPFTTLQRLDRQVYTYQVLIFKKKVVWGHDDNPDFHIMSLSVRGKKVVAQFCVGFHCDLEKCEALRVGTGSR